MYCLGRFVKHIASRVAIKMFAFFLMVRRKMACLLISLESESIWPQISPHLNYLNFQICGYMKD